MWSDSCRNMCDAMGVTYDDVFCDGDHVRVQDAKTGKSVIIKQAGIVLRISDKLTLSPKRDSYESEILQMQNRYVPGSVPALYGYDTVMCASCMDDLSDY